MPGVVETSNNLSIVRIGNGKFESFCLCRSSVETAKEATAWKIAAGFQLAGCEVELSGSYPGWKPNMDSAILVTMNETYNKLYGKVPEIKAIHAGLECGIIMGVYPKLDSISFGPTIRYPHSLGHVLADRVHEALIQIHGDDFDLILLRQAKKIPYLFPICQIRHREPAWSTVHPWV